MSNAYNLDWPTNYHWWYHDIGAADHNVALWATFHERHYDLPDLKSMPWWDQVDKIFILGQESDCSHWVYEDPRIWVWDSRYLLDRPRFFSYFWWWWQTMQVEKYQNALSKLIDPRINRPRWHFDCLLGRGRRHRDLLAKAIEASPVLRESCFVTGAGRRWMPGVDLESQWPNRSCRDDSFQLPYIGEATANVCNFLPYLIYNQSWFSVVTETRMDYNFFTEKTAKVLLGLRMFVALGAPNLLAELRAMGFETFGAVMDESYDCVLDDHTRWQMAVEQIIEICRQDPLRVYEKILPVLKHNQQHLLKTDIEQKAKQEMIDVLCTR